MIINTQGKTLLYKWFCKKIHLDTETKDYSEVDNLFSYLVLGSVLFVTVFVMLGGRALANN